MANDKLKVIAEIIPGGSGFYVVNSDNVGVGNQSLTAALQAGGAETNKKADKTYVDTELGKKSDKTYVDEELGKKADKTTVSTLQTQVNTNTTKTVDLQSQIDELVIEAGGDSNPEVLQARTDENGVAHTTLKDRIDSSFTDVKGDLHHSESFFDYKESPMNYGYNSFIELGWEQGTLYNGEPLNRTYAVRTSDFFVSNENKVVKITTKFSDSKYRLFYATYNMDGTFVSNSSYRTGSKIDITLDTSKKYKFVISTSDDSNINPDEIKGFIHFAYSSNIYIDENEGEITAIENEISNIKSDLNNSTEYFNYLESPVYYGFNSFINVIWENGSLYNGENLNRNYAIRFKEKVKFSGDISKVTKVFADTGYQMFYAEYNENGEFIGNSTYRTGEINSFDIDVNHYYRFVFQKADNTEFTIDDAKGKIHFVYSDNIYENIDETLNHAVDADIVNAISRTIGAFDGGCIVFTCDDGQLEDYEYLYPIIREFDVPFVFGMWSACPMISDKLSDVKSMINDYNCEVAQHGIARWTNSTDYISLYGELKAEKSAFKSKGIEVTNAIYPYNDYNDAVKKACSALYTYACGGGYHVNSWRVPALETQRIWVNTSINYTSQIDSAVSENKLIVYGIHAKELKNDTNILAALRNIIQYAKTKGIAIKTLNKLNTYF